MGDVSLEILGDIAVIRLQRPARRNILDRDLIRDLTAEVRRLADRREVAAAVLTGDGPSFCAGADLHELRELSAESAAAFITQLHDLFATIGAAPQVVIAAINGHALGAGCELIASCDLRIAAEDAVFGMPEIRVGIPSVIEAALLVSLIGLGRAAEMVYTGETIGATEAKAAGLVNRVVPAERLLDESLTLATSLAALGHDALRLQKRLVQAWASEPMHRAISLGIDAFAEAFQSDGPREGMTAFLEHRPPRYRASSAGEG